VALAVLVEVVQLAESGVLVDKVASGIPIVTSMLVSVAMAAMAVKEAMLVMELAAPEDRHMQFTNT